VSNVTVTVTAPASGSLTNVASVSSPTGDPNSTNNVTLPGHHDGDAGGRCGLGKTGATTVLATSNLVYTISVTNFGPSSASSVTVTDTLPLGVTFVSATGGGVNNSGVVNWSLGTLTGGQASNVTVTVTAPASGSLTNTANSQFADGRSELDEQRDLAGHHDGDAGGGCGPGQDRPGQCAGVKQPGIHDIGDELWTIQRQQRNRNGYVAIGA